MTSAGFQAREFIDKYNRGWLLERHGYRTPAEVRQALTLKVA